MSYQALKIAHIAGLALTFVKESNFQLN